MEFIIIHTNYNVDIDVYKEIDIGYINVPDLLLQLDFQKDIYIYMENNILAFIGFILLYVIFSICTIRCFIIKSTYNDRQLIKVSKYVNSEKNDMCTICIDDLYQNEIVCTLPCKHIFHDDCFEKWRCQNVKDSKDTKCPNCNITIKDSYDIVNQSSNRYSLIQNTD